MLIPSLKKNFMLAFLLSSLVASNYGWSQSVTELSRASERGDLSKVNSILEIEPDLLNIKNPDGETALIAASLKGHAEVVNLLLEKGADVNLKDNNGATALIVASLKGHAEVVNLLLEKGSDVNVKGYYGTALIYASRDGHANVVKLLLEKGADVNVKNDSGVTALIFASLEGHVEVVKLLLEKGADVNAGKIITAAMPAGNGKTALFKAVETGNLEIAKLLLTAGADPNIVATVTEYDMLPDNKKPGFVFSPQDSDYPDTLDDIIKVLSKRTERINSLKSKKLKIRLLEFAKKKGNKDIVTLLKKYGAK